MNFEGRKCVVCSAYLFEDDDIIVCPECGAPHHRDCWNSIGRCRLEELHGTEQQYKYEPEEEKSEQETAAPEEKKASFCRGCGAELERDARFCPYCNLPVAETPQGIPFAPGVSYQFNPEEELEDGVTMGDAAKAVAVNGYRYIPKFKEFKNGKKTSWNWAAFIWPHGWHAFRKMYALSAIFAVLIVVATLLTLPLAKALDSAPDTSKMSYTEAMAVNAETALQAGPMPIGLALLGLGIEIGVRVTAALYADRNYKKKIVETCKETAQAEDKAEALRKKGGISLIGFAVAVFGEMFLANIIAMFL